ncbi:MAG: tetratricopeptide repeat protein, partial [Paenibacillus macerans]|nr:tetratricopeptide repeat protein [Paenibacillus macerans]
HYDKALKYFRKAVEYEPENPVNHCNMAGILSEMGDYEASNEVLATVLRDIDPTMTECYFYMANNYANMDLFEAAEEALVTYLEEDASGYFLTEAEEMMDLLQYELDRPTKLKSIKSREGLYEHDQARALLEEGKFNQAVKLLEELVQGRPDFLAARNNLALGYYYLGHFDKAMSTVHEVLAQDPGNLHGLCNLAVFYQHEGNRKAMEELAERLSNIVPFHQEHVFKLATTMGMLGRHEAAFGHFKRLLQNEEMRREPSVSHYAAVAAYYTGRYAEARRLWQHVKRLDPGSSVAGFYLAQLDQSGGGDEASKPFSVNYQYLLPFEEQLKRWETSEDGFPADLKDNPLVRSSFFWALR